MYDPTGGSTREGVSSHVIIRELGLELSCVTQMLKPNVCFVQLLRTLCAPASSIHGVKKSTSLGSTYSVRTSIFIWH